MATLAFGCARLHLWQRSFGTISLTAGISCKRKMHQRRVGCSPIRRMQAARHGISVTKMITQPGRSLIAGAGRKWVVATRKTSALSSSSPSSRCLIGEIGAARGMEEDFVAISQAAEFKDTENISEWKGERQGQGQGQGQGESAVIHDAAVSAWRFELDSLLHGHVGKLAFLAILLLGVGVGCLNIAGDAEAATNHINGNAGLDVDMRALAMGPEGPLLEEFWDNMRRYGLYFLTVVTGGIYQLVKPVVDAFRNPLTAVLVIIVVSGSIYLVGLTVSAMLGINEFNYLYAQ